MRVRLIAVPYDSGFRDARMGAGAIELAPKLAASLAATSAKVETIDLRLPSAFHPEIAAAFAIQRSVAREVARAHADDAFPIVLAGNCNTAVGTVAALTESYGARPQVFWFDAHADFNTPESTRSGFLDGMAVSILTGRCWSLMAETVPGFRALDDSHVVYCGVCDLDEDEAELVNASAIARVGANDIGALSAATAARGSGAAVTYVHLDLDVLDSETARANSYA